MLLLLCQKLFIKGATTPKKELCSKDNFEKFIIIKLFLGAVIK